jgi:putative two-component system response regulator
MDVVIVDDNLTNVTLLKHLVRRLEGCQPHTFTDARAGLDWCLARQPDLVLVDYMMPAPDGMAFIQRLRAEPGYAELPILMVTAAHEREVRYQALQLGANDFLTKPVDTTEFLARARNMLALRRSQKRLADRAAWLAEEVDKATAALREREQETVLRLSKAAEYRDPETGAHLLRIAHYCGLIAGKLGLPGAEQELLSLAAPMHDVGKVGIPDSILLKPGRLTAAEYAVMQRHPAIGHAILDDSRSPLLQMAATIALTHHEKWDGSGYPHGLAGEAIPLHGRIVAVADVFDALTSERPYKQAWPQERALRFLREGRGTHFDPACVDALLSDLEAVGAVRDRFADPRRVSLV